MEANQESSSSNSSVEKQKKSEDLHKLMGSACEAFEQKKYDKCIKILDQLIESKAGNVAKHKHNRLIAEFYKSDRLEHSKVLDDLRSLLDEMVGHKKEPSPFLRYNLALAYFHKHMFNTATEVLTPLIDKLDVEEDNLRLLSSILMLRIMFALNQRNRAMAFLNMIKTKYFPENTIPPICEELPIPPDEDDSKLKLVSLLTHVLNRQPVAIPDDGSAELAALKAHQLYVMKDFQMAAKQLQKIVHEPKNVDNHELNTCIANNMGVIHMRVRHYALAASFFQKALQFDKYAANEINSMALHLLSTAHSCEILYNLGISMLYLRRPQNAFQCFLVPMKAYQNNPTLWYRMAEACIMDHDMKRQEEEKKPLYQVIFDPEVCQRRYLLKPKEKKVYKTSVSAAVPELNMEFAVVCLRNALRLAKFYKQSFYIPPEEETLANDQEEQVIADAANKTEQPQQSQTSPVQAQVQQPQQQPVHPPQQAQQLPGPSTSQAQAEQPSLSSFSSKQKQEMKNWKEARDNNFVCPSKPITKEVFDQLFCSIYASFSYVSLRNGDYIVALEMAQELLKSDGLSDAHRILAHMYAGEALIMMQRFTDAHKHLDPCSVLALNAFDFETKDWEVKSVEICQNLWRYNIAVAHALQGEYELSRSFINTVNHPIIQNRATALKIYLQSKSRPPNHPSSLPHPSHHHVPHPVHMGHGPHVVPLVHPTQSSHPPHM